MPRRLLVIDGDDKKHFFLSMLDGTLTVGTDASNPEIAVRDLRAVRIRCELEIDADSDAVVAIRQRVALGAATRQEIHAGETMDVGHSHVKLVGLPGEAGPHEASPPPADTQPALDDDFVLAEPEEELAAPIAVAEATESGVMRRLLVIDGADRGRTFPLNALGPTTIGKSAKHADIVLHDLYVARVHCQLEVEADRVVVSHCEGQGGTLVNGKPVTQQELHLGDVVRVGNSHLRFELGVAEPRSAEPRAAAETVDELEPYATSQATTPAAAKPGSGSHPTLTAAPADVLIKLENQILGHYQFGALLGRGQSGLVFRAHHRQTNQPVTIKVLSPEFPNGEAEMQAFIKAIKSTAALRHPHLVTLHAAGKTGPYCWIAREFIDGESIRTQNKPGWKYACRVALHLGRVLDFLHQSRVIHGNITPPNVLVETASKQTKLADLMLDQAIAGSKLAGMIADNKRLAELPYRSPEQMEPGTPRDATTDLYAVGAIVYGLLTGQPPHVGETADAIIRQAHLGRIVKPSKHAKDTPPPFEAAVMSLLATKPEDRFTSAAEMLSVIEPIANMHEIG